MKIVVAEVFGLSSEQKERLKELGKVTFFTEPAKSKEEKLARLKDADIICGETKPVIEVIYDLKDKLISFPFVGVGWLDLDRLAQNNVKIANAPGCNKIAVSEWILAMMLNLSRKLQKYIGVKEISADDVMEDIPGLADKKITILGRGNIGSRVGKLCEAFDMKVSFFDKNNDLIDSVRDADFVVNCLAHNKDTERILNDAFFNSLKDDAFFISITDAEIYDKEALFKLLDSGKLAGAAIDPAGASIFDTKNDFYRKLLTHPKIVATPHIAFHTENTVRVANDIMIDNVEAWTKKSPINIVN